MKKIEQFNEQIKGKKVAILGLGVSNKPLVKYFTSLGCDVSIYNEKELEYDNPYNAHIYIGKDSMNDLSGYDYIFRSPSILPTRESIQKARQEGAIITSEIEEVIKNAPCTVIGVTGSDGKTTTTTLINEVLKANGYITHLGGNIGTPIFTDIRNVNEKDVIVLELSSFQLMGMNVSPDISIITNISENHLDIHKDYEEYINSKENIYKHQTKKGILVVNYDKTITKNLKTIGETRHFSGKEKINDGYYVIGNKIYNKEGKEILDGKNIKLRGHHNYCNIATVLTAINDMIDLEKSLEVLKNFAGVEHRLEFIRNIDGASWYNDSVSSSPTRTIAGLYSYDEPIILIAGGYDKNISYAPLGLPILEKCKCLILMGNTKEKIKTSTMEASKKTNKQIPIYEVDTLEEAVNKAKEVENQGDVVLFSPASASFDMFKNFADRGNKFKALVNKL